MRIFTFVYIISLMSLLPVQGQDTGRDSISRKGKYGLRIGVEIGRPVYELITGENAGFEIRADYPLGKKGFLAAGYGSQHRALTEERYDYSVEGVYASLGYDRNIYENFPGFHHEITVGLHYTGSVFSQEVQRVVIGNQTDYFGSETLELNRRYEHLQAHWLGLRFGVRAEVLPRFFLGMGISLNKLLYSDKPENFALMYAPGFYRIPGSGGGFALYYTLSYTLPVIF